MQQLHAMQRQMPTTKTLTMHATLPSSLNKTTWKSSCVSEESMNQICVDYDLDMDWHVQIALLTINNTSL